MDNIHTKATQLNQDHSKAELIALCRAKGWKGDPERAYTQMDNGAYIHQTEYDLQNGLKAEDNLATGKLALAYWLAGALIYSEGEQPTPAPQPKDLFTPTPSKDKKDMNKAELLASLLATPEIDEAQINAMIDKRLDGTAQEMREIINKTAQALEARVKTDFENLADDLKLQATPREIKIHTLTGTKEITGNTHWLFEKVLRLTNAGLNVLLTGEAGAGKTHLAMQVADALNLTFDTISCTAGASESQLMGWLLPSDGGRFEYQPAPFVNAYEKGNSLFLFDEIDAGDPNFLLVANSALSNNQIHIPQRRDNPKVERGDKVHIMATANTYGTGADMVYAGRNQLDGATLDRWYTVHIDYNEALEAEILGTTPPSPKRWKPAPTDEATVIADHRELGLYIKNLRAKVEQHKMRRIVSTRAFIKAQKARSAGIPMNEIKADLVAGWTKDELQKVGA